MFNHRAAASVRGRPLKQADDLMRLTHALRACLAEMIGTGFLVFFGTGAVFVAVLTGALSLFDIAMVWGIVIALAIYAIAAVSGCHINPAVTIALAAWRRFPLARVPLYLAAQLAGAAIASLLLLALFGGWMRQYEQQHGIVRGEPGSERTAMVFGEYFPNPAAQQAMPGLERHVTLPLAMAAETLGAAVLVFCIFAFTDERNGNRPPPRLAGVFIGLTVTLLICVIAPLTQACFNPARDLGPRLVAYLAGWDHIAIPGPRGGFFTVYILSPILGGLLGGGLYDKLLRPGMGRSSDEDLSTLDQGV
jgi:glycerol uptake facilitator protein